MNAVAPTAHKPQPETAVDVEMRVMFLLTLGCTDFDGTYKNTYAKGQIAMPVETTYTSLRERLASVLDQVANDHAVVIVRRHAKDVALVPAEELTSLLETAHLLRSPKNAQCLLAALQRATRRPTLGDS